MYLNPDTLSVTIQALGWLIFFLFFFYAIFSRPWRVHINTPLLTVLPAFVVGLMLLWLVKAGVHKGLEVHLLGLTALTLMFGTQLSVLAISAVYCVLAVLGKSYWGALGWNMVLIGILPILLAAQIHRYVYRRLPHNFFIFVFLSSFLNGALVMIFTLVSLAGFLWLSSSYSSELITTQIIQLIPLLAFPEAFLNGGLMAILVIYRPQWVSGFSQDHYLSN